jgi:acyl-CoA dehydrogenase
MLTNTSSLPSPYFHEEHEALRAQIRRFVESEIKPHGPKWEEQGFVPREVLRRMGELGFLGIRYPAEYGGAEMDTLGSVVLAEELGRSTFSGAAITVLVHTDMASVHMANGGTDAQKAHWMPEIIAGRAITAVAVTEPDAGSDVKGIRTTARRDGESYVLNGAKMFITNGVHADLYFVAAKTAPDARPSQQISMFMVEKGTPGFRVSRALDKHGWRSSDTAELAFEDCRVPAENLLGQEGRGFYSIMSNFQNERTVIGAMAMGEAQAALDLTLDYVTTRKAFGAPLFEKQAIRQRLAMLAARVEAGRQLVYHAAFLDAQGVDCTREVSMVKALCGELVNEVMYDCLQFHGGMGFMRESTIERMARDARVQNIGGGTTEVMLEEVAKRMRR